MLQTLIGFVQAMSRNLSLYRYFQFARSLLFWQAIWFLYFQGVLSAQEAIVLAALYDIGVVALEVPSGYLSDVVGRKPTLVLASLATAAGCFLIYLSTDFATLALAQILLGAGTAFASGSDNAFLYDTLAAEGREDEVADQELIAWRYQYLGLAASAVSGGIIGYYSMPLAFLLSALASGLALALMLMSTEPPHSGKARAEPPLGQLSKILAKTKEHALLWVFVFVVVGYSLSHVPFVFAQPYLRESLVGSAWAAQTPIIAGLIVGIMMLVSVIAGQVAPHLNARFGDAGSFLVAAGMQLGLISAMALVLHPGVIPLLLLRMVPDALSRPYMLALVQPRLESAYRASYLSVQSLIGRIFFSIALFAAAAGASQSGELTPENLSTILPYFAAIGLVVWIILAATRHVLRE